MGCEVNTTYLYNYLCYRANPIYTFVDYIRGGCQIDLIVAVDFTVRCLCVDVCECVVCFVYTCMYMHLNNLSLYLVIAL